MSGRTFTIVATAIWSSPRFLALDCHGRLLALYVISGPHQTSAGVSRIKEGYVTSDLEWEVKQYRKAKADIIASGMFEADGDEILVEDWFRHCPPVNLKHAIGTMRVIDCIGSDDLRVKTEDAFAATKWGRQAMETLSIAEQTAANDAGRRLQEALDRNKGVRQ